MGRSNARLSMVTTGEILQRLHVIVKSLRGWPFSSLRTMRPLIDPEFFVKIE